MKMRMLNLHVETKFAVGQETEGLFKICLLKKPLICWLYSTNIETKPIVIDDGSSIDHHSMCANKWGANDSVEDVCATSEVHIWHCYSCTLLEISSAWIFQNSRTSFLQPGENGGWTYGKWEIKFSRILFYIWFLVYISIYLGCFRIVRLFYINWYFASLE